MERTSKGKQVPINSLMSVASNMNMNDSNNLLGNKDNRITSNLISLLGVNNSSLLSSSNRHPPHYITTATASSPISDNIRRGNNDDPTDIQQKGKKPKRPLTAYNFFFRDQHHRIVTEGKDSSSLSESDDDGYQSESESRNDDDKKLSNEGNNSSSHRSPTTNNNSSRNIDVPNKDPNEEKNHDEETSQQQPNKKRRKTTNNKKNITFQQVGSEIGKLWKNISKKDLAYYNKLAKEDSERYRREMEEFYKEETAALFRGCINHSIVSSTRESSSGDKQQEEDHKQGRQASHSIQPNGNSSNEFNISRNVPGDINNIDSNTSSSLQLLGRLQQYIPNLLGGTVHGSTAANNPYSAQNIPPRVLSSNNNNDYLFQNYSDADLSLQVSILAALQQQRNRELELFQQSQALLQARLSSSGGNNLLNSSNDHRTLQLQQLLSSSQVAARDPQQQQQQYQSNNTPTSSNNNKNNNNGGNDGNINNNNNNPFFSSNFIPLSGQSLLSNNMTSSSGALQSQRNIQDNTTNNTRLPSNPTSISSTDTYQRLLLGSLLSGSNRVDDGVLGRGESISTAPFAPQNYNTQASAMPVIHGQMSQSNAQQQQQRMMNSENANIVGNNNNNISNLLLQLLQNSQEGNNNNNNNHGNKR